MLTGQVDWFSLRNGCPGRPGQAGRRGDAGIARAGAEPGPRNGTRGHESAHAWAWLQPHNKVPTGFRTVPAGILGGMRHPAFSLRVRQAGHAATIGLVGIVPAVAGSLVGLSIPGAVAGVLAAAVVGSVWRSPEVDAGDARILDLEQRLSKATEPESGSARFSRLVAEDAQLNRLKRAGKIHGSRDR